jgi:hypothetical protein
VPLLSNDSYASVNDSGPTASRSGWEATAYAGSQGVTMTVIAICTVVTSLDGQERTERDQGGIVYRGR